jgi:hypothetical protein
LTKTAPGSPPERDLGVRGVVREMNLNLVHRLLKAANEQPYGFLKVRGSHLAREVEMMAAAGLVESPGIVHGLETYAVINRLTDSGQSFLRAFRNDPPLPGNPRNGLPRRSSRE